MRREVQFLSQDVGLHLRRCGLAGAISHFRIFAGRKRLLGILAVSVYYSL